MEDTFRIHKQMQGSLWPLIQEVRLDDQNVSFLPKNLLIHVLSEMKKSRTYYNKFDEYVSLKANPKLTCYIFYNKGISRLIKVAA